MKERIGPGSTLFEEQGFIRRTSEVQQQAVGRQVGAHYIKEFVSQGVCPAFYPPYLDISSEGGTEQITTTCPNKCGAMFVYISWTDRAGSWIPFRYVGGKKSHEKNQDDFFDDLRGATTGYTSDLGS